MLSLRYHRQYLWVCFALFFILAVTGLVFDCLYAAKAQAVTPTAEEPFVLRTPRFINVVGVGIFSILSILAHHYTSRAIVKPDLLAFDRKTWISKSIKVKTRRKIKKVVKRRKYILFTLASMFSNVINMIPIILIYALWVAGISGMDQAMKFGNWSKRTTLAPEFFIPTLFVKYLAWYLNAFCAWFYLFRKRKRQHVLFLEPLNI